MIPDSALDDIRVLDLGGPAGAYCGKLLADLGADVILVEPPEGHIQRHRPPYLGGDPGIERAITFLHFHTSKRGLALRLTDPAGAELFRRLAATADVVLDGSPNGLLDSLGIGSQALRAANPRLIWAALTPFGLAGPRATWVGTDFTIGAAGGYVASMGWEGDPPLRPGGEQAYHTAGQHAALGILTALLMRETTGEGQLVDISAAESVAAVCALPASAYAIDGSDQTRGPRPHQPPLNAGDGPFPCQDGQIFAGSGPVPLRHWPEFIEWMNGDGIALDWAGDERLTSPLYRNAHRQEVEATMASFFERHTKAELCDGSIRRGFMLFPIQHAGDLFHDPQLRDRGYWQPVPDPARGRDLDYPGPPYRLSETPARVRHPAPTLGQHSRAILTEDLGLSGTEFDDLVARGVVR